MIKFQRAVWMLCCWAALQGSLPAQERVLPPDFNADKTQQMMRSFLRHQVEAALNLRTQEVEGLTGAKDIADYQKQRQEFLRWSLGEMPARSPLNPQVTGRLESEGCAIEKVIFESQPGFFVTGNLYLPTGPGTHPAILHPCGHTEIGKAFDEYQKANLLLARNGFVVLCYDPIGQGERKQLLDDNGKPLLKASGEHQALGTAPVLLGRGLSTYMLWDAVRALDYLQTRPEVDGAKLGCTGNSGGGNLTSFLMAYDDRIAAAAPGCFMTTHLRKNESPGPGDAEQNLFAQIRDGFDHPDFILSRAPKPTLILAASQDFVPIEGTWEAFRQAKRIYTMLGYPERVDLVEAPEKHGFTKPLREGAVRFFARWLQGREMEVFEPENVTVYSEEQLRCTAEGQVTMLPKARSLIALNQELAKTLAAARAVPDEDAVREVTGIRAIGELPEATVTAIDNIRLKIEPEPGIVLPAWFWSEGKGEPCLVFSENGVAAVKEEIEQLRKEGHPVLAADLRDLGETLTNNWRSYGADAWIAYMLGRSYLAMRTEDVLVCARELTHRTGKEQVWLVAHGEAGPPALHAAALEPDMFSKVRLVNSLVSWQSVIDTPVPERQFHNVVHGALAVYDLPALVELAGGKEKVERIKPLDAALRPVP